MGLFFQAGGGGGGAQYSDPVVIDYTDVQTGSVQNTYNLVSVPARSIIEGLLVKETTQFLGVAGLFVQAGDGSQNDEFLNAYNLGNAPSNSNLLFIPVQDLHTYDADGNLVLTFTGDSNLSNLSAGELTAWYKLATIPAPS